MRRRPDSRLRLPPRPRSDTSKRDATAPESVRASASYSARQHKLVCPSQMIFSQDGARMVTGALCNGHGTLRRFALLPLASLGTTGRGDQRGHGVKEDGTSWSEQSIGQPSQTRILQ